MIYDMHEVHYKLYKRASFSYGVGWKCIFFLVSINLIDSNEQALGAFVQLVDKNILFNG